MWLRRKKCRAFDLSFPKKVGGDCQDKGKVFYPWASHRCLASQFCAGGQGTECQVSTPDPPVNIEHRLTQLIRTEGDVDAGERTVPPLGRELEVLMEDLT